MTEHKRKLSSDEIITKAARGLQKQVIEQNERIKELEAEKAELVEALKTVKFKLDYCACEVCVEKMCQYVDEIEKNGTAEWKEDEL